MKTILIAIALLGIGILGMAFNIVFRKKKFPNTHVGGNKELQKRGIVCANTMDRIEQKKAKEKNRYKKVKILNANLDK